jgi:transcription antitermination protein NusB
LKGARTKARKRALDLLYAAELRGDDPIATLDGAIEEGAGPTNDYTAEIVRGVVAEQARIDELLSTYSRGWTLARMPAIDRNVLRLGAYELSARPDVPVAVVIDEAVELAKRFSTDDSGRFVNGVLSALVPVLRST